MAEIPEIAEGTAESEFGFGSPEEDEEQGGPGPVRAATQAREKAQQRPIGTISFDEAIAAIPDGAPTAGEAIETVGKAAVGGALKTGGAAAGGVLGFKAGVLGSAAFPPAAPAIIAGATLLGVAGGYFAGDLAADELQKQDLAISDPATLPEELRPFGIAGEALGAGAVPIGGTMALAQSAARLPSSAVGRVINRVLDTAKEKPFTFAALEAAALSRSAVAEGVFEAQRPGHPLERTGVGIAAGMMSPLRLTIGTVKISTNLVKRAASKMSPAARRTSAGKVLQEFLDASGDDPAVLMRALRDTDDIARTIPGFKGTAAQTTGDVRLAQLEAALGEADRPFYNEAAKRADETLEAISNAMSLLRGTGDPESFRIVAELRKLRYTNAMERLLNQANRQAVQAAETVGQGASITQRANLSIEVTDIYTRALGRAREVEKAMWEDALPDADTTQAVWRSVKRTYSSLKGELAAADALPDFITDQIGKIGDAALLMRAVERGETLLPDGTRITKGAINSAQRLLSVGELARFRSALLARSRGLARSTGELSDIQARQYGLMAESVLDDMIRAGAATRVTEAGRRGVAGKFVGEMTPFDEAREFSRALNDTYSRSFVGAAQQQGAYGMRMPPETLMKRAFATGDEVATLQLKELEDAVNFLPTRGIGDVELLDAANVDSRLMMDAQSRLMRMMASRTVEEVTDPDTGETITRLSLRRARRFLEDSGDVLERFPEVRENLEAAVKSQDTLQRWANKVQGLERHLSRESTIARVLDVESPVDAVRGAISSKKPVENLTRMAALAKGGGREAQEGFRSAIWQHIIRQSETPDKGLSLQHMVSGLTEPVRPGGPSLLDFMVTEGLIPDEAVARIDELIEVAGRVLSAQGTIATGEEIIPKAGIIGNLLTRVAGSEAARRALRLVQGGGPVSSGPTLIAAQRGSQAAQDLIERLPNLAVKNLLIDALSGAPLTPDVSLIRRAAAFVGLVDVPATTGKQWSLLEALMEEGGTEAEKVQRSLMIHAYAWQAGLLGPSDQFEEFMAPELRDEEPLLPISPGFTPPTGRGFDPATIRGPVTPPPSEPLLEQGRAEGETLSIPEQQPPEVANVPNGAATRGERNNNPGNIRKTGTAWRGEIEGDDEFETFSSPQDGVRALAKNLLTYQDKHNLLSVRGMISRWAPPNENDTEKYVAAVAEQMGVRADEQLNLAQDPPRLAAMVRAIIQQENGRNIYDLAVIEEGVAAAL